MASAASRPSRVETAAKRVVKMSKWSSTPCSQPLLPSSFWAWGSKFIAFETGSESSKYAAHAQEDMHVAWLFSLLCVGSVLGPGLSQAHLIQAALFKKKKSTWRTFLCIVINFFFFWEMDCTHKLIEHTPHKTHCVSLATLLTTPAGYR